MFKNIVNYVREDEFAIHLWKGKVNVVNFQEIILLEEEKMVLLSKEGKLIIKGENLSIQKLLDCEILITGKIQSLELEA